MAAAHAHTETHRQKTSLSHSTVQFNVGILEETAWTSRDKGGGWRGEDVEVLRRFRIGSDAGHKRRIWRDEESESRGLKDEDILAAQDGSEGEPQDCKRSRRIRFRGWVRQQDLVEACGGGLEGEDFPALEERPRIVMEAGGDVEKVWMSLW
ncbi:hypothetical protein WMY93_029991 [Mugilogobius chulae]|uniref:Uncharacterized protein n=1 Tax=Mugilogobius chulae TaxID=88201 RepID=A0AAW0MLE2_9GOBI